MNRTILLVNGPNLNMLGVRKPEIYGTTTLVDIVDAVTKRAAEKDVAVLSVQSNHEGDLIDAIQTARAECAAIIINPGALTHTSVAIRDALESVDLPIVEVHISNIHRREEFRHHSYISGVADAVIAGCGAQGYVLALEYILARLDK